MTQLAQIWAPAATSDPNWLKSGHQLLPVTPSWLKSGHQLLPATSNLGTSCCQRPPASSSVGTSCCQQPLAGSPLVFSCGSPLVFSCSIHCPSLPDLSLSRYLISLMSYKNIYIYFYHLLTIVEQCIPKEKKNRWQAPENSVPPAFRCRKSYLSGRVHPAAGELGTALPLYTAQDSQELNNYYHVFFQLHFHITCWC